ncbi:hypothetical protein SVI_0124 [Shewanella violacea DSS12]|uniref:Uncharacterized protein n=1 Tax=Shewanella violacea (strain JCM 10179 / CIP 106290 / LMG 19151 / DSS12) TaxID=637905 RepID=D4ZDH3_SHEVD|nr:hypothetical protein SVI_0124 [Shewanella violacea DSS12]
MIAQLMERKKLDWLLFIESLFNPKYPFLLTNS